MPIPWAAAAKVIPWGEVIAAAPRVVKSARELWNRSSEATEDAPTAAEDPVLRLEARVEELDRHLRSSSELIAQLAEHNERLVVAIDRLQRQLTLTTVVAGVALLGAIGALLIP